MRRSTVGGSKERIQVAATIESHEVGLGVEILHGKTKCIKFNGTSIITTKTACAYEVSDNIRGD
jgi:hypothetical protein